MVKPRGVLAIALLAWFVGSAYCDAQSAPASPDKVWNPKPAQSLERELAAQPGMAYAIDQNKKYTLAELIDLAEEHNPDTRVAWQAAKSRAAALGIAKSALYPTMAVVALGSTVRQAALIGEFFHRQTLGLFEPSLYVEYLIFDVGGRSGAIDVAKANLLASDLAFNDTHRKIIFQVASSYYRLLNAEGQREAAEVSLRNAQTVEEDVQSRLENGLATKPDQLEATAARAQSDFDLQAAIGNVDIARGNLLTQLGLPPESALQVQGIDELTMPSALAESVDQEINRAFAQRPDLMQQLAQVRAANASIKEAKSKYFPTLSLAGDGGWARAYGQQDLLPGSYAAGELWDVELRLKWTLFDGARREYEIAQAKAERKQAQANVDALRDEIANEVWAAYSNMKTAQRQQQAAAALLTSSQQSYEAAHEAYGYGVRSLIDVVSAQKTLAQARSEDIFARAQLLLQVANLAFRTGDLTLVPPAKTGP
jgi:outer membrane protein TolC